LWLVLQSSRMRFSEEDSGRHFARTVLATTRAAVLVRLLDGLALGGIFVCGLFLYEDRPHLGFNIWLPSAMALGFSVQRLAHGRLGFRRSAAVLLAQLALSSSYVMALGRFTPAAALLQMMLVLSASVFFGRKASLWALAFCLATLAAGAASSVAGYMLPANAEYWNPARGVVWVRYSVVLAFFGGSLALAFASIIRGMESSIASAEDALQREYAERARSESMRAALERSERVQALGELAAGIAHDFNNALTVVIATCDLMRMRPEISAEISQFVDDIHQVAGTAATSARQLLALGRDEQYSPKRIAVVGFLSALKNPIGHLLRGNITCSIEICTSAEVVVDSAAIQQALFNLAINARDAMPNGGTFRITATESDVLEPPLSWGASGGRFVVICCHDTGTGIDAATMERIFQPFFTTKSEGRGTGLGLAMVRKAVCLSGGYVEVESVLGSGTAVRVCLPVAPVA
jgi:signal transduction histidine kinase